MKAALKFVGLARVGDVTCWFTDGFETAEEKSLKPSSPKRSVAIEVVAGLGAGGEGAFCVKEKSKALDMDVDGACAGLGAGGLVAVPAKKLPPLNGGGEDTCAATGGDLAGIFVGNPRPENDAGFGGDAGVGKPKDEPEG